MFHNAGVTDRLIAAIFSSTITHTCYTGIIAIQSENRIASRRKRCYGDKIRSTGRVLIINS